MARVNQYATILVLLVTSLAAVAPSCSAAFAEQLLNPEAITNSLKPFGNLFQDQMDSFKEILQPAASFVEETSSQLPEATARQHLGLTIKDIGHKLHLPLDDLVDKTEVVAYAGLEYIIKFANYGLLFVERSILPDVCLLRSLCYFGKNLHFLKHILGRISPPVLEGSIFTRAVTRGILGVNCDDTFVCPSGQPATETIVVTTGTKSKY